MNITPNEEQKTIKNEFDEIWDSEMDATISTGKRDEKEIFRYEREVCKGNEKKEFPFLLEIRMFLRSIGITTGNVERCFSICKTFSHRKRNRVSVKTLKVRLVNNYMFK